MRMRHICCYPRLRESRSPLRDVYLYFPMIAHSKNTEAALFFRVATRLGNVDWTRLQREPRSIDWNRLIAIALLENSVTVLNDWVATLPSHAVPSESRERIGRLALIWTFKLRLLEQRLLNSVEVLSRAGIEVTLLKGAALAVGTYPRFSDRPMADIDLLVDQSRAGEAYNLMQAAGWSIDSTLYSPEPWHDHHHLPPLSDTTGSGLRLEIHVAPLPRGHPFRLDLKDVLARSDLVQLGESRVRVLEPHLHAVHAAIHFAWSHRFESGAVNIFRDLAALHTLRDFSWEQFVARSHETRSETCCYWTMRLARELTSLPVPSEVLAELAPVLSERLLSVLEQHFSALLVRASYACPSTTLRRRLWALALDVKDADFGNSAKWLAPIRPNADRRPIAKLRLFADHVRRVPTWSRYVASLFALTFETFA